MKAKTEEAVKLQLELTSAQEDNRKTVGEKEQLAAQVAQSQSEGEGLKKSLRELEAKLSQCKADHQKELEQLNDQLNQLGSHSSALETTVRELKDRVSELEPLTEALEEEKLRRIKVFKSLYPFAQSVLVNFMLLV